MPTDTNNHELIDREASFRILADAAPFMIWLSGTDKLCYWFNKSWLQFTGHTLAQESGNGWSEGVHPDDLDRCLDIYNTFFDRRLPFRMKYRLLRHDGIYRWIDDVGAPRFNDQTQFEGYIGSCTDITELMQPEPVFDYDDVLEQMYYGKIVLTPKETQVLEYLSQGCTVAEIAQCLYISSHTVIHHKKSIFSKLGTSNALKTIAIAKKLNLIKSVNRPS